ncbi:MULTISPECIES: toll/interleukin-1 receptor domain-containing protein [unclassified Streptomyces]|uniref:toll/interleukin-1 receptor domain-containing protein n=1 Tax=unclassified Streptomyces TaxID=2593676 RepID=UPI0023660C6C|nr:MULTISPECIES: toll/interleukin-1 receptor domain-containing protein [unclassified Streptomyces]MDF3141248.1 toll/interleukin-1 receptor domain-containing protein [Streptomyces sp. T21Q-yed]WDF38303.1 toll/interleukin-1 receptor domain-containing protein [Streptomyces sp. T12]
MERDAFISYSHKKDVPLAQALEDGLKDILRTPWLRRSRVKVFRDTTSLSANHDLDGSIKAALAECRYFIYLASPEAARSRWVREEIRCWRRNHGTEQFLIALSDGSLGWDPAVGDFDWADETIALPPELRGAFPTQPLWVDLRKFRSGEKRSMKPGEEFRDRVATLAAPLHGVPKDALDSTDLRIQRKAVRILRFFVAGLLVLSLLVAAVGLFAWQQRGEALSRARTSASQALAARALDLVSKDPRKAAQFALYAQAVEPTGESAQALSQAVVANGSVVRHLQAGFEEVTDYHGAGNVNATNVAISRDGSVLAYYSDFDPDATALDDGQRIHLYDIAEGKALPHLDKGSWPQSGGDMEFSADGRTLAVERPYNRVDIWDTARQKLIRTITASEGRELAQVIKGLHGFAFSGDGRRLAATFFTPEGLEEGFHVAVWDVRTGHVLTEESAAPRSLTLGFDGENRLVALDHAAGRIRDLAPDSTSWSAWRTLPGFPRQEVAQVSLSADSSKAYVGEGGQVWDLVKGRRLADTDGGDLRAMSVPSAAGGNVYAADDRKVSVYDSALRLQRVLGSFTWPVFSVSASGDGRWVAAGSEDGAVSLFATAGFQAGVTLPNEPKLKPDDLTWDNHTAFRADASGTAVWSVTGDGVRKVGRLPLRMDRPRQDTLVASLDGTRALAAQEGVLSLWDPRDGSRKGRHVTGDAEFQVLAFMPDGIHAAATTEDAVRLLDTRSWKVGQSIGFDRNSNGTLALSADRTTLVRAEDSELTVWTWAADEGFREVCEVALDSVWTQFGIGVAVGVKGERVALINGDRMISVLDVSSGKFVRSTSAAPDGTAPAFSGDNAFLVQAGGSADAPTLQFWDATTTESRGTWTLPRGETTSDPADTRLLTDDSGTVTAFGADGSLVRRTVDVAQWQEVLCDLVPQELPQEEYDRYLEGLDVSAPCRDD